MTRLFVAALPKPEVVEALRRLPRDDGHGVRPVPEENWHVTLRFLGDVDPTDVIDRLRRAPPHAARAVLGPQVERLGRRQVVAPVAGVDALAAAVRHATAPVGDLDPRPFRGHLTLVRVEPGASSVIEGATIDARWDVTEIAVVESTLTPDGARYTTLATIALDRPTLPRPGH